MASLNKNSTPAFARGKLINIQRLIADEHLTAPAIVYFTDLNSFGFYDIDNKLYQTTGGGSSSGGSSSGEVLIDTTYNFNKVGNTLVITSNKGYRKEVEIGEEITKSKIETALGYSPIKASDVDTKIDAKISEFESDFEVSIDETTITKDITGKLSVPIDSDTIVVGTDGKLKFNCNSISKATIDALFADPDLDGDFDAEGRLNSISKTTVDGLFVDSDLD